MKTLKNDTRYIIKRVLIGVLIAIVLFNARKCGVYALTSSQAYCRSSSTNDTITKCNIDSSTFYAEIDENIRISQFYGNPYGNDIWNKIIIALKNKNNGDYIVFLDVNSSIPTTANVMGFKQSTSYTNVYNLRYYSSQNEDVAGANNMSYIYITTDQTRQNSVSSNAVLYYYPNQNVKTTVDGLYFVSGDGNGVNYDYINPIDWEYVSVAKNLLPNLQTDNIKYYYTNNTNVDSPLVGQFPPSGYSELDLTGYQGVIFVPKNYSTMDYNSLYNLDFNYYYKGRVRDGYFLLNNSNQHYYDTDILISDEDYTERNGFYTLAKVQTTEGITNTTTIEYSAFVVYNSSPTGDWQGDILPPYGESYVVYDSTLYDYYLVEDFSTFNETICFYDFENNQICINVKSLPTLNDVLSDANSSTTNEEIPQQKINYILEFLKLPIRSLRRVAEGTCEAITLPIPIIGGTIQLNCLSSLFQNVLGPSFEFFRLIINGLLLYRLTIHNIKVFKDVLDPSNTGIEVINL